MLITLFCENAKAFVLLQNSFTLFTYFEMAKSKLRIARLYNELSQEEKAEFHTYTGMPQHRYYRLLKKIKWFGLLEMQKAADFLNKRFKTDYSPTELLTEIKFL